MARDTTKLQYWTEHIKNWQSSGLAQRAYCEREGLKWPTFDCWRRQLLAKALSMKPAKKKDQWGQTRLISRNSRYSFFYCQEETKPWHVYRDSSFAASLSMS